MSRGLGDVYKRQVSIILFLIFVLDFTIELQVSITPMAVITLIGAVLLIELLFYFLGF